MEETEKCPRCKGEMEWGQIWSYGGITWGPKLFGKKRQVYALRCKNCGFLESYAK